MCGRLKSDYRYSAKIVYNNFPWPEPTEQQKQKIEETAHRILDARALFPDSSLADMYDPLTMPTELRRAHIANDKAVMASKILCAVSSIFCFCCSVGSGHGKLLYTIFAEYL